MKETAYKGRCAQEELEELQNRAARFVTRDYTFDEGSMTGILEQHKWESPQKRRQDMLLNKGLKVKLQYIQMTLLPRLGFV